MVPLPWPQIGLASGWAVLLLLVYLIARAIQKGDWIPRSTHERELTQANDEAERARHDGAEWRTEGRLKDQQLAEKDIQLRHMEEVGKTVTAVMGAIQSLQGRKGEHS